MYIDGAIFIPAYTCKLTTEPPHRPDLKCKATTESVFIEWKSHLIHV